MTNIVDFRTESSRPRRSTRVSEGEAQILFFTGVRYFRENDQSSPGFEPRPDLGRRGLDSPHPFSLQPALDLAAH